MPMPPARSRVGLAGSTAKPVPSGPHIVTLSPETSFAMRDVPRPNLIEKHQPLRRHPADGKGTGPGQFRPPSMGPEHDELAGKPAHPSGIFQHEGEKSRLARLAEGNIVRDRQVGPGWRNHGDLRKQHTKTSEPLHAGSHGRETPGRHLSCRPALNEGFL